MRLHVDMLAANKKFQCTIACEVLRFVDKFTAGVVALPWETFGILVGKDGALRFAHRGIRVVLGGDQLNVITLTHRLFHEDGVELWVNLTEAQVHQRIVCRVAHGPLPLPNPDGGA